MHTHGHSFLKIRQLAFILCVLAACLTQGSAVWTQDQQSHLVPITSENADQLEHLFTLFSDSPDSLDISLSEDGNYAALMRNTAVTQIISIWDLTQHHMLYTVDTIIPRQALVFASDNIHFVTNPDDHFKIYDIQSGTLVKSFEGIDQNSGIVSPDSRWIAFIKDSLIHVYSMQNLNGDPLIFALEQDQLEVIMFGPDSQVLVGVGMAGGLVIVEDLNKNAIETQVLGFIHPVSKRNWVRLNFTPDGQIVYFSVNSSQHADLFTLDMQTKQVVQIENEFLKSATIVGIFPNHSSYVFAGDPGVPSWILWNVVSGEAVVDSFYARPLSDTLMLDKNDEEEYILVDIATGNVLSSMDMNTREYYAFAFNQSRTLIASHPSKEGPIVIDFWGIKALE